MTIKTIALTGAEASVNGLHGANAHIRNDGTDIIYAAKTAGITAGADGVLSIPARDSATLYGISGGIFMLGSGSVMVVSSDYAESPFKTSAQAGGSGADDVARAAISAHAGNTEIHVTAEEKATWNSKADLDDIPETLPANGGSADSATYQYQAYIGIGIDILDYTLNNVPDMSTYLCGVTNCPTCPTNYGYDADNNDFYYRISRYTPTYAVVKAYDIGSNNEFMNTLSNGVWTGWNKCSDNGNAAALGSHPASDFVLKSDYDALEARVAALESGSTT